ncbi:hypothetical protein GCM10022399_41270 [Terrabacter ginsenosidimutans]|uniref:Uncharacterized protein n=1 Tax=Terrabacter ginsenosidimutans TaxID=490575 RepID=A0ABP7EKZ1_9MICO
MHNYLPFLSNVLLLVGAGIQFVLAAVESAKREKENCASASNRRSIRRIASREGWYRNGWVVLLVGTGVGAWSTWPW